MEFLTQDGTKIITTQDFLALFPDLSFPTPIPYADFGWFVVAPQGQPTYDPITQSVREIAPIHDGSHWLQQWEIVALDDATVQQNLQRKKEQDKQAALAQIMALQQKALRALVEDAPDTTYLEKYKAEIATLRETIK